MAIQNIDINDIGKKVKVTWSKDDAAKATWGFVNKIVAGDGNELTAYIVISSDNSRIKINNYEQSEYSYEVI